MNPPANLSMRNFWLMMAEVAILTAMTGLALSLTWPVSGDVDDDERLTSHLTGQYLSLLLLPPL